MIRNIEKDINILSQKSVDATEEDISIINDLVDTLTFYRSSCVGMAANMISQLKNIIAFVNEKNQIEVMVNPKLLSVSKESYDTEEGCLSLKGERPVTRYEKIKVQYLDKNFKIKIKTFTGFTSQIIQHELDHLHGIII